MEEKEINIEELGISIKVHKDVEYWQPRVVHNYTHHYQVFVGEVRIMGVYFDLETSIIAGITFLSIPNQDRTSTLTNGIRNLLGLNITKELTDIVKVDGDKKSDGEVIDSIVEQFEIDIDF